MEPSQATLESCPPTQAKNQLLRPTHLSDPTGEEMANPLPLGRWATTADLFPPPRTSRKHTDMYSILAPDCSPCRADAATYNSCHTVQVRSPSNKQPYRSSTSSHTCGQN
ncbi:Hypothetical predicted protein [Pelobates cultripes]|uniref:Uncharacterized protein n=1 Tax=Pelobates cultripes TaxID=61616 RepID=A0AAD1WLP8_PELCU|nr:Hypothetical predicted protein [Pelobates cultripes]